MHYRYFASFFCLLCLPAFGANSRSATDPQIAAALHQLYDSKFEASRQTLIAYSAEHPADPLGYTFQAATFLFADLDRTGAMKKSFLTDDRSVSAGHSEAAGTSSPGRFDAAVREARRRAEADLAKDSANPNALLAMCIVSGIQRDHLALVEHRLRESYEYIKESQAYSTRLLAVDPHAYDAYLTKGFTEYLIASLPFYLRVFMKIDGISITKEKGLQDLQVAADSGQYMKPFAQLLLAMFYLREKQGRETERLLAQLASEYPNNATFRTELAELNARHAGALD